MQKYKIKGNTYSIKEDLKSWGCIWDANEKCWVTPPMDKESIEYKRIDSISMAVDADLIPEKLSEECKKIQSILSNA